MGITTLVNGGVNKNIPLLVGGGMEEECGCGCWWLQCEYRRWESGHQHQHKHHLDIAHCKHGIIGIPPVVHVQLCSLGHIKSGVRPAAVRD